jgi:WD40 repeat protein
MVRIRGTSSRELISEVIGGVYAVPELAFSPSGGVLASTDGRNLRLREIRTQRLVHTLYSGRPASDETSFSTLAYSPDGRLLASGDTANTVQLWDTGTGELLQSLSGHTGRLGRASAMVWKVRFSPDGSLLASAGGDTTVRLWEVATGKLLETLNGHTLAVTSLAFSPDGQRLASGSLDATVIVWKLK